MGVVDIARHVLSDPHLVLLPTRGRRAAGVGTKAVIVARCLSTRPVHRPSPLVHGGRATRAVPLSRTNRTGRMSRTDAVTAPRPLLARLGESRTGLGLLFMLPAAAFLLVFLTYPLGLGVWLAFTDTRIG